MTGVCLWFQETPYVDPEMEEDSAMTDTRNPEGNSVELGVTAAGTNG